MVGADVVSCTLKMVNSCKPLIAMSMCHLGHVICITNSLLNVMNLLAVFLNLDVRDKKVFCGSG